MYCRWTEVRCNYARSVKTSVWLAFLDACTSSWLRGNFIVLTVLLDRRMYRYMCATTLSSRSSRSWSFTSGWFPASSVGLDCLVETAGIFSCLLGPCKTLARLSTRSESKVTCALSSPAFCTSGCRQSQCPMYWNTGTIPSG